MTMNKIRLWKDYSEIWQEESTDSIVTKMIANSVMLKHLRLLIRSNKGIYGELPTDVDFSAPIKVKASNFHTRIGNKYAIKIGELTPKEILITRDVYKLAPQITVPFYFADIYEKYMVTGTVESIALRSLNPQESADLLKGLMILHINGIAHQDVREFNLYLSEGTVKLMNFSSATYTSDPAVWVKDILRASKLISDDWPSYPDVAALAEWVYNFGDIDTHIKARRFQEGYQQFLTDLWQTIDKTSVES